MYWEQPKLSFYDVTNVVIKKRGNTYDTTKFNGKKAMDSMEI
jgi:hypothetical protein